MKRLTHKSLIRPIIVGSCVLVGGILLTGCQNAKPASSTTSIKEAEILYDMGKNQEALDFYNQKLAGNSTDYASYITRGKILVKLGRYDDAINDFYKASKLDNSKETYMLYKGLLTMQSAVDINALDALNLTGTTNLDMYTFYHCALLYKLDKTTEASACLDKLLAIDNNNPQGNFLKATTLIKSGKYKDSIKYFDKAEQGWLATEALRANKWIALAKSELTGGITYLDKALAINANDTGALYAKALTLLTTQTYKEGVNTIDKAISLDNKNKDYHILRGDLMMRLANYGQAIASYDKAFALDGKNSDILAKKAVAQYQAGDTKSMKDTIAQAENLVTNNANRYLNLSTALIRVKQYEAAMTYVDKALILIPDSKSLKFAKALDSYLLNKLADSATQYTSLRGSNMVPNEAKIVMSNYLLGNDDYAWASKLIEQVLKVDPTNDMAHATKVKLYIEMTKAGQSVPDSSFDYTTPDVVNNALIKLDKYSFLKNYR